tara:strand:+ start:1 stop:882 length:882 start_codon:yes stop_codon:yes gene_type:complete
MNNSFIKYIKNKNIALSHKEKFVGIIGSNPSKGARSPSLWNKVYKKFNKNIKMYPLDVEKKNIKKLIFELNKNKNFLGGSVTVPFKETIKNILKNNLSNEAKIIGAINCLYRNQSKLRGTNTDGEGSVKAFKNFTNFKKISTISFLGCGGAGKAVATYFAYHYKKAKINIFSTNNKNKSFARKINANFYSWKEINKYIYSSNLIINCTDIGFNEKKHKSPLSVNVFKRLNKNTIIYDIIYQPKITRFLNFAKKNKLKNLNGLEMNLQQAALGFLHVNKSFKNLNLIKKIMINK